MVSKLEVMALFTVILMSSCNRRPRHTKDNQVKNTTLASTGKKPILNDNPRSFVKNYGAKDNNKLFVFVGEKISVELLPERQYSMDNAFKARYAILKKVYGDFPKDTIEFVVYDHYGLPAFSKFKNVLLYVSADSGTYYHQKYIYNDVYKAKNGRWAGAYALGDYEHTYNKHTKIKPVKIDFTRDVSYPTEMVTDDGNKLKLNYPEPYFKTVGSKAIAIYGNYIEDLFKLKRDGVLTARGLFEATAQQEEDMVEASTRTAQNTANFRRFKISCILERFRCITKRAWTKEI